MPDDRREGGVALRLYLGSPTTRTDTPPQKPQSMLAEAGYESGVLSSVHGVSPYVSPEELTERPVALERTELYLPDDLMASGAVVLRLYIGTNGMVERVDVTKSQLPPAYGAIAAQMFLQRNFSPGRIGNKPVPTFTEVEVEFNPSE